MNHRQIAVTLAGVAAFINLYAPQSLLPLLRDWIGHDAARAGLIVSAGTFGVALAAPFAGLLADRYGRRRVIVAAAFLAVFPGLLAGFAPTPELLMLVRLVQGLCLPGIFAVTVAYIAEEWPPAEARKVTAIYVAGTIGGGFCGRLLSGVVAEFFGWRAGFVALAFLQLGIALVIRAWLPPGRDVPKLKGTPRTQLLPLLNRPGLRGAYATGFLMLFSLVGGFTYMTLHLSAAPFRLGPAALSAIFAVYLAGVVVTPLSGRLLNAFGHARVLVLAWAVAVVGLLITLAPSLAVIAVGLCLFSVGLFVAQTATTSFVGESAGAERGPAVGLYVTCYYLGGSAGGVVPALLWHWAHWPGVVGLLCAAGAVSAAIGWRSYRFPKNEPHPVTDPQPEIGGEA
jgi:predicted MFS family arabinose efflux permease